MPGSDGNGTDHLGPGDTITVSGVGGTFENILTDGTVGHVFIGDNIIAQSDETFNQTGGTFTANEYGDEYFLIGEGGASGIYNISGASSVLNIYSKLYVGFSGYGTLNINGGKVSTHQAVQVGYQTYNGSPPSGTSGTVNQSGGTFTTNGSMTIGAAALGVLANGAYNLSGGSLSVGSMLVVPGSTYLQTGGNLTVTNTLEVASSVSVKAGTFSAGNVLLDGGGVLTLDRGSLHGLTNGGTLNLGGTATLTGKISTFGVYTQSGGTANLSSTPNIQVLDSVTITGGTFTTPALRVGSESSDSPTGNRLNVAGGVVSVGPLTVGLEGPGSVVQTGGTLTTSGQDVYVGMYPALRKSSMVSYSISAGSLSTGRLCIGYLCDATFIQTGGSVTTNNTTLRVGANLVALYEEELATYTLTGGTLSTGDADLGDADPFYAAERTGANLGNALFQQSGGTFTTNGHAVNMAANAYYFAEQPDASSHALYQFDGGTLNAGEIAGGAGVSTFHFNGGTLQPYADNANFVHGLTTASVQAGGAIVDTSGFNVTIPQVLTSGTAVGTPDGGLTKVNGGMLILTGANTYTGATTISGGMLDANNTSGSATGIGAVSVNSGASLGGNGSVAGPVTVNAGGGIFAVTGTGYAPSQLTLGGSLTLRPGAGLAAVINGTAPGDGTGGGYSELRVGGPLTLNGTLTVLVTPGFHLSIGEMFTLIDDTGVSLTAGTFANAPLGRYVDAVGHTFAINYLANVDGGVLPNDVTMTYLGVNVPEPGAVLIGTIGAITLGVGRRRRDVRPLQQAN